MDKFKTNLVGVMPAYNEEENIQKTAVQWYKVLKKCDINAKLIVINDGSKDNTEKMLEEIHNQYPNIIPITKENGGHGKAVLFGYEKALEYNPKWIFQTDSDGQTIPKEFMEFWYEKHKYDVLMGARVARKDGFSRFVVTKTLKMILLLIFGKLITDANVPFRLMKSSVLRETLPLIPRDNNLPNILLSVAFLKKKYNVKFKAITFRERQGGVNSINIPKIVKIGFKAIKDFYKFKKNLKLELNK